MGIPGSHKSLVLFQCEMCGRKCEELYIIPSPPRLFKLFLTHISLRCGSVGSVCEGTIITIMDEKQEVWVMRGFSFILVVEVGGRV